MRATIGDPIKQPYLVHLERLNGVLRDRLDCLTRKTHAFARETTTWDALFSLVLFEQYWMHPHIALRVPWPNRTTGVASINRHPRWRSI